ncbi:MAG: indolepyruvate oxidoreductase subunit beta [Candidatus Aquicultor sp.]|nr:indolepyruvate oxidoreductase subunit beta [Candidatus Aquicultor sp.]
MSNEVRNVLIVGVGGQGIILAADVLSNVLVSAEYDVKMAEIHGMSQRGGSVNTMVRFGNKVYSPVVEKGQADYMLAFEKLEALRWSDYLKPGATIIMNDETLSPLPVLLGKAEYPGDIEEQIIAKGINLITVNATAMAEESGSPRAANIVLLGCLASLMPLGKDVWHAAIERRVPPRTVEINKSAFEIGFAYISERATADEALI